MTLVKIFCRLFFYAVILIGCDEPNKFSINNPNVPKSDNFVPFSRSTTRLVHSQTVYVPIYSSINRSGHSFDHLSSILSVRNISPTESIVVSLVDYYDTNGKLLKHFIDQSFELGKMSSKDFLIPASDLKGGTGANFIVKWETENLVSPPLIESIMIGILGTQGFGFTSRAIEIEATFK